jgi:predicted nucleotide-binding protein
VIQALITGKKLVARTRQQQRVTNRETLPQPVQRAPQPPRQPQPSPQVPRNYEESKPLETSKVSQELPEAELLWTLRQIANRQRQEASNEVFIVHGHDEIRHEVSGFISSLSLSPIMLDEKPNRGQTILQKLEHHAYTSFAVVLLTSDDEGRKRGESTLHPRARQNVVLELGYFLARLGSHRVCALYVPGVELPSDIQGLLYVELDQKGGWKYRLQREMVAAGIPLRLPS